MPTRSTCQAEIERFHDHLVEWFTGTAAETEFEGLEGALAPDFEMVTPEGNRRPRPAVLDGIRESYGRYESSGFDIDIRSVELLHEMGDYASVRYEEWQELPADTTGRLSTVLFRAEPDAPGGLLWVDLHETWLD